jgi:hypothetical protein
VQRDLTPYDAVATQVDLNALNPERGANAERSRKMDFRQEDLVDDELLNEAIWHAVRGEGSVMPAPTRAAFVRVDPETEDKD